MRCLILLILLAGAMLSCQRPAVATPPLIPEGIAFLSREAWGAKAPVLPMRGHEPTRLTLHHTATAQHRERTLGDKLRALQRFSQEDSPLADGRMKPAWADIPYHLYVDAQGAVGEGRDLRYAGDSNTAYDPAGHLLVVVEGNFEKEQITPEQMRTLELLVPHLARRYSIPADSIAAHKDFAQTACPGMNLYTEIPRLQRLVARQN